MDHTSYLCSLFFFFSGVRPSAHWLTSFNLNFGPQNMKGACNMLVSPRWDNSVICVKQAQNGAHWMEILVNFFGWVGVPLSYISSLDDTLIIMALWGGEPVARLCANWVGWRGHVTDVIPYHCVLPEAEHRLFPAFGNNLLGFIFVFQQIGKKKDPNSSEGSR